MTIDIVDGLKKRWVEAVVYAGILLEQMRAFRSDQLAKIILLNFNRDKHIVKAL